MTKIKNLLFLALLLPATVVAQSRFDGTWKIELASAQPPKAPETFSIQNGVYRCDTCVPKLEVEADSRDQKVAGSPFMDTLRLTVIDDHHAESVSKKDGKITEEQKYSVSADGNTLTIEFTDTPASGPPSSGKAELRRIAKGAAGSHAISGTWQEANDGKNAGNTLLVTYRSDGHKLSMSASNGASYTATLDGGDAPYNGNPNVTSISVKQTGSDMIEATYKRDGLPVSISRITVSADGKTMSIAVEDTLHKPVANLTGVKQ